MKRSNAVHRLRLVSELDRLHFKVYGKHPDVRVCRGRSNRQVVNELARLRRRYRMMMR